MADYYTSSGQHPSSWPPEAQRRKKLVPRIRREPPLRRSIRLRNADQHYPDEQGAASDCPSKKGLTTASDINGRGKRHSHTSNYESSRHAASPARKTHSPSGSPESASSPHLDQPAPEITMPQRREHSIFRKRTNAQRWEDALERTRGDLRQAKHVLAIGLIGEHMVDAVASDDTEEISRLKARRRCEEREFAISNGRPPPRRRIPHPFSNLASVQGDAAEEVVREDDWSTDEEDRLKKSREEDQMEYHDSDEENDSNDSDNFVDIEPEIEGLESRR